MNTNGAEVAQLFDQLAEGYDCAALRFYPFTADQLAQRIAPQPGEKILDIATGTGAVAIAVAQRLQSVQEWWEILRNTGFRGPLLGLMPEQLEQF